MSQTVLLGDLIEDVAMGPFGSNLKTDNFIASGVPVIRGGNLYEQKVGGEFVFVSEEKAQSLKRSLAYPNDIVITHRGTLGQVSIVPGNEYPYYLASQSQLRLTPNKKLIDPIYLLYYLRSPIGQHELMQHAAQVGVPSIASPTKAVKSFKILLPDMKVQQQIVRILESIDEKIELNRRMNETLEQMCQTLFRHYFIDNPAIKKWPSDTLSELIELNPRESIKAGEVVPYLEMKNLSESLMSVNGFELKEFKSGTKFRNGDTLLARITPCLENGKTAFVDFLGDDQIGFGSTEYIVMRPKKSVFMEYTYLLSRSDAFRTKAIQSMVGTSGRQRVQNDSIATFKIKIPEMKTICEFHDHAQDLFIKIKNNADNAHSLSELRDLLLPRLITGKVQL